MRERELADPVRRHLESRGYHVWVDPDGSDFLDVVARKGEEVALVELKVADWRRVLAQAIRRRGWADWVAVVLPRRSIAERLLAAPQAARAQRVGVWAVSQGEVDVVRDAKRLWEPGEVHPFPELRERILVLTDGLLDGTLSAGVRWNLPGSRGRLPGGRRATRDWRLEEFPTTAPDG
jgi:hypothetical protein